MYSVVREDVITVGSSHSVVGHNIGRRLDGRVLGEVILSDVLGCNSER